jgi:hypothetical protein
MKIVPAADVPAQAWDDACERSSRGWLFHRSSWIALEERFFGHRSLAFAVMRDEEVLGVQPLYVSEIGIGWLERVVHSGIHRHTGFAPIDSLPAAIADQASALAMRTVMEAAVREQADRVQLNSQNLAPANLGPLRDEVPLWAREFGFDLGLNFGPNGMLPVPGMATCCADQIVSLGDEEGALFSRLSESCRRAVRKAQKAGIQFDDRGPEDAVEAYWQIAQAAAVRTGESLPNREYFTTLDRDLQAGTRRAFLFASHNGVPVAGLLLAIDKQAVSYLGGVSLVDYLPMRVNDFLHWSAMCWARRAGHGHYRFGPAFPQLPPDWPIARVSRFKQKFGARSVTTIQGSFFLQPEKYLAGGLQHLSALCQPRTSKEAVE